jgi:hypothetical protein
MGGLDLCGELQEVDDLSAGRGGGQKLRAQVARRRVGRVEEFAAGEGRERRGWDALVDVVVEGEGLGGRGWEAFSKRVCAGVGGGLVQPAASRGGGRRDLARAETGRVGKEWRTDGLSGDWLSSWRGEGEKVGNGTFVTVAI